MLATIRRVGLGCLIGFIAFAVQASHSWLVKGHPNTYVVQEGDTLWSIAGQFLNDPWRWKEVWRASPDVKNPNLIYPGDVIVLTLNGKNEPELTVQRYGSGQPGVVKITRGGETVYKLSPQIRTSSVKKAIPTIPFSVIGPFLSQSKITPLGHLENAYEVSAVDEEHLLASEGKRLYAKDLPFQKGDIVSIFKRGRLLTSPETEEVLGEEAIYLGSAQIERANDMSTLVLENGDKEIRIGDKILLSEKERVDSYFLPKAPNNDCLGYILSVLGGVNQIGQYDVVTIAGGYDLDREEGDVLDIFQSKHDFPRRIVKEEKFQRQLYPSEPVDYYQYAPTLVGRMIVFRVFEKASMALVTDATRPIYLHDVVRRP